MTKLSGPEFGPASGGAPKQLFVILHGYGADGANLIDLAPALAPLFPDAYFISPNAPQRCEMSPTGYQWFSLLDRSPPAMLSGVQSAAPFVQRLIDEKLAALGLTEADTAIIGFSQGTMTGLEVALSRAVPLKALVGFSGAMMTLSAKSKTPVCLIHGDADEVVPYQSMAAAETALQMMDVSVETHTRPHLGHGIDNECLVIAAKFLAKQFGIEMPPERKAV